MNIARPLSESIRPEVAFCLWALCRDGLRAAPFDRHATGDGQLVAAGLDADGWRRWVRAVVGAQERVGVAISGGLAVADVDVLRRSGRAAADPVRFAPPKLRGAVSRYWRAYRDEGRRWRLATQPGLVCRLSRREQRAFVAQLDAETKGLSLYLAAYPAPVAMAVHSQAMVLGIPAADRQAARAARDVIFRALREQTSAV